MKEETGLEVESYKYISSYHISPRNLLMLGYVAHVQKAEFIKSCEVDQINWFSVNNAMLNLREGSTAKKLFETVMSHNPNLRQTN